MKIIPAIDLQGGKCVRLFKGDFAKATEYSDNPAEVAATFSTLRVADLHVVDLDGARVGTQQNRHAITTIVRETELDVQLGGGLRSRKDIAGWMDAGVARCVIGSMAVTEPDSVRRWLSKWSTTCRCWRRTAGHHAAT